MFKRQRRLKKKNLKKAIKKVKKAKKPVKSPKVNKATQALIDKARPIKLFECGVLIQLGISFWSMRAMLTRDDYRRVGINPDKLPKDLVNLGRKLLVPKEIADDFISLDHAARNFLGDWSVTFGISNTHFVPFSKLQAVTDRLEAYKAEFNDLVADMVANYDKYREEMRTKHPDFWEKCLKAAYPDKATIRSRYRFQWFMFQIGGATLSETSSAEAVARSKVMQEQLQEQAQSFVEDYVVAMRREVQKFCGLMKARMNGEPFEDEGEAKRMTARTITALQKYVLQFKEMNIFGDNDVQKMLDEFNAQYLSTAVGKEDFQDPKILATANEALAAISAKAATEGEPLSQFIGSVKRRVVIS